MKYIKALISAFLIVPGIVPVHSVYANDGVDPTAEVQDQMNETAETDSEAAVKTVMHRLYNPNSGEHFYTASLQEKNHLVSLGWKYEGEGWTAPDRSETPVYRLYNPIAGEHHYTMGLGERDYLVNLGWKYEGIGWYSDDAKGVPLYRRYNPNARTGCHNYTTSKGENDNLVKLGWRAEGIGWYALEKGKPAAPSKPLDYREIYRPCVNHAINAIKGTEEFTEQDNGLTEIKMSSDQNLYYSLQDLNGDGVPELSLCEKNGLILQLFTAVNGKPVFVTQGWVRSAIYYIGNGFKHYGSAGYMSDAFGLFTLNSNGSMKWSGFYFSLPNGKMSDWTAYRNTSGSSKPEESVQISKEEYIAKSEEIQSKPSKLSVSNVNTY